MCGATSQIRTDDPFLTMEVLYLLSYSGLKNAAYAIIMHRLSDFKYFYQLKCVFTTECYLKVRSTVDEAVVLEWGANLNRSIDLE